MKFSNISTGAYIQYALSNKIKQKINKNTKLDSLPLFLKYGSEAVSQAFIVVWVTHSSLNLEPEGNMLPGHYC